MPFFLLLIAIAAVCFWSFKIRLLGLAISCALGCMIVIVGQFWWESREPLPDYDFMFALGLFSWSAIVVIVNLPIFLVLSLLHWRFGPKPPVPGHCRRCGYNLTGLTEARCPECGTGFEVARGTDD